MRRFTLYAVAAVLAALFLTAAFAQAPLKLTGWPYQVDTVNANLARFQQQTGISATFSPFPSDNYHDKMVASFVGGTDFDVVYVRDNFLAEWASAGWLTPIDGMPGVQQYVSDLPGAIVNQLSYDGKLYGLPYYSGMSVFAYNADQLKQAGVDQPPKTWDELLAAAKKVKDAGISDHPIILELKKGDYITQTLEIITAGFGGKMFNDTNEPVFQEQGSAFRSAVDWIRKGLEMGVIDPASLSSDDHDVTLALSAGTHTFTLVADYNLKTINDPEQSKTAGQVKNALIPGNGSTVSGTTSYVRLYGITSNSKNKDEAWKLVQFLGGKDATGEYYVPKRWALDYGLGFAYTSMYNDPDIRASLQGWINPDILSKQADYAVNRSYRFTPYFSDWQTSEWGTMQNLLSGSGSMDKTLDGMAKHWNDLKSQYGG